MARVDPARGTARRVDGLGDVGRVAPRSRRRPRARPQPASAAARPAKLTDSALHARARSMVPYIQQTFENAMRVSTLSSIGSGALGAICAGLGDPTMAIRLLAGIEVDSAAPSYAMWDLGRAARASAAVSAAFDAGPDQVLALLEAEGAGTPRFVEQFDQFLLDYGSRGQNEYDPRSPSWEIRPRIALAAIDLMRKSDDSQAPAIRQKASVVERDRVAAEIREKIAGDPETAGLFEAALRSAQLFLAGRERAKTNCVMVINELRMALYEYGGRLVERGLIDDVEQVFMLTDAELDQVRAHPEAFRDVIAARWAMYKMLFDYEPVFIVNGRVPGLDEMTHRDRASGQGAGTVLTGAAGSGGARHRAGTCRGRRRRPGGSSSRATCWWRRRPIRRGCRCSCRLGGGGQRRCDGEPRHDRVARARHPLRGLGGRWHRHHPRRGDRDRRRQRRHGDDRQRADSVTKWTTRSMEKFDVVVIGTGAAGLTAALVAAESGASGRRVREGRPRGRHHGLVGRPGLDPQQPAHARGRRRPTIASGRSRTSCRSRGTCSIRSWSRPTSTPDARWSPSSRRGRRCSSTP